MKIDFTGRTALITGGTRGIGGAIGDVLERAGARVLLTGTQAQAISHLNEQQGSDMRLYFHADFSSASGTDQFLKQLVDLGAIDILINNAGINRIHNIEDFPVAEYDLVNEVNLRAPYLLSRHLAPGMKQRAYGRIINIASIWGVITKAGRSAYSATKHAIVGLTKTLAVELGPYGILVNAVSPGFTLTELTKSTLPEAEQAKIATQIPVERFAEPAEIARVVAFLASAENSYITGQNIVVDGGFVIV